MKEQLSSAAAAASAKSSIKDRNCVIQRPKIDEGLQKIRSEELLWNECLLLPCWAESEEAAEEFPAMAKLLPLSNKKKPCSSDQKKKMPDNG